MELGVLDLQLIVDLLFVEKLGLHLLDLVEVIFDERDVLLAVQIVHLDLELRVIALELLHQRNQDVPLSL